MKQSGNGRGDGTPKSSLKSSRRTTNRSRHRSSKANAASSSSKASMDTNSTSSGAASASTSSKTLESKGNTSNSNAKVNQTNQSSGIGTGGGLPDVLDIGQSMAFNIDPPPMITSTHTTPTNTFTASMENVYGASGNNKHEEKTTIPNISLNSKNQGKCYPGLDARSIRTIWEQHDQSDVELSTEVCARVAEDVSHKLWELITNIKIYARHSGGMVTYDLVNEVLKDADVPPSLGAMDSDWERIDCNGTFYYYSDKILELRDEYQREITFERPLEKDISYSWPIEEKQMEHLKEYVPNMIYVLLNGEEDDLDVILSEAFSSPFIGCIYRLLLNKLIQIIAFRQNVEICVRCWRLLRSLARNPQSRDVDCRLEYFHLTEILICQLLAPTESIKISFNANTSTAASTSNNMNQDDVKVKNEYESKLMIDDQIKIEQQESVNEQQEDHQPVNTSQNYDTNPNWSEEIKHEVEEEEKEENVKHFKLLSDDDETEASNTNNTHFDPYHWTNMMEHETATSTQQQTADGQELSGYFATPVDMEYIDDLCATLGSLAAINGYFHNECIHHIQKRLKRFFSNRQIQTERDYQYINRAIRGLIALGGYAFRTFIPFIYELKASEIPESICTHLALSGVFLRNQEDEYLYEWLAFVCGADKLQPYLTYYANYYAEFLCHRYRKRKKATYYVTPKLSVRRLEWSTVVADMCHGDDPNKPVQPKPTLKEAFPHLTVPRIRTEPHQLNREIHFRFAGCRPVVNVPKEKKKKSEEEIPLTDSKDSSLQLESSLDILQSEDDDDLISDSDIFQELPIPSSLSLQQQDQQQQQPQQPQQPQQQQQQHDIIIARRRLLKPLSNEKRFKNSSNYYCLQI